MLTYPENGHKSQPSGSDTRDEENPEISLRFLCALIKPYNSDRLTDNTCVMRSFGIVTTLSNWPSHLKNTHWLLVTTNIRVGVSFVNFFCFGEKKFRNWNCKLQNNILSMSRRSYASRLTGFVSLNLLKLIWNPIR